MRGQLSGTSPEPFLLEGEDWFELPGPKQLTWPQTEAAVETEQQKLAAVVTGIDEGRIPCKLSEAEHLSFILGITCHAVYHAGQIQLLKRLHSGQ